MTLSSHSIRRASAISLAALTFVACSDSTGPLDVTPDQLEIIGEAMATEIESGVTQLTAGDAIATVDAPQFSIQRRTPANVGGIAFNLQRAGNYPSFQVVDPECGVFSQNPPTDSDADQVPDNLTITFAVPACRFVGENGSFDLTGVIRVTDPLPGTAGMAFTMASQLRSRSRLEGTGTSGAGMTAVTRTRAPSPTVTARVAR